MNNGSLNRDRLREFHDERFAQTNPRPGYAGTSDDSSYGWETRNQVQVAGPAAQARPVNFTSTPKVIRPMPPARPKLSPAEEAAKFQAQLQKEVAALDAKIHENWAKGKF